MDKLTDIQKRWIVLGIGVFIVLLGVVQGVFKPAFMLQHQQLLNEITFILMVLAAMLLFSRKRKPQQGSEGQDQAAEQAKLEESVTDDQSKEPK